MTELKPCPFCGSELHFEEAGFEHPHSDTCPLDSLYIEDRHIAAWNTRAALEAPPDETAALRAKLAEVERAAYERGVRDAADAVPVDQYHESWMARMLVCARVRILALLTQEGR